MDQFIQEEFLRFYILDSKKMEESDALKYLENIGFSRNESIEYMEELEDEYKRKQWNK
jgi:hypothetical protein